MSRKMLLLLLIWMQIFLFSMNGTASTLTSQISVQFEQQFHRVQQFHRRQLHSPHSVNLIAVGISLRLGALIINQASVYTRSALLPKAILVSSGVFGMILIFDGAIFQMTGGRVSPIQAAFGMRSAWSMSLSSLAEQALSSPEQFSSFLQTESVETAVAVMHASPELAEVIAAIDDSIAEVHRQLEFHGQP